MDAQGPFQSPGWGQSIPGAHLVCAGSEGLLGMMEARFVGRVTSWKGQ